MNEPSSSSSSRPTVEIPLWDAATVASEVTAHAATVVSEVTAACEEDGGEDGNTPLDDSDMQLDDSDVALLSACPKKTARQKAREQTGRNRRRAGVNQAYYNRWAWVKKPDRKHQSHWEWKKK